LYCSFNDQTPGANVPAGSKTTTIPLPPEPPILPFAAPPPPPPVLDVPAVPFT